MKEQQTEKSGRNGWWLIIPFIVIIALLAFKYNSNNSLNVFNLLHPTEASATSFSPENIAQLMKNFSYDYVAGECISKKFVGFRNSIKRKDGVNCIIYDYYLTKNAANESEEYAQDGMKERLSMWSDIDTLIHYTIRDKAAYDKFIEEIRLKKDGDIPLDRRIVWHSTKNHYIYNGFVWIDAGYSIEFQGYCVSVYSMDRFKPKEIEKAIDTATENNDSSIVYTIVNVARVYKKPDAISVYEIGILPKGSTLQIIKKEDGFYYCDYYVDDSIPATGYVQIADVNINKPE